jgi:hypothetical protein
MTAGLLESHRWLAPLRVLRLHCRIRMHWSRRDIFASQEQPAMAAGLVENHRWLAPSKVQELHFSNCLHWTQSFRLHHAYVSDDFARADKQALETQLLECHGSEAVLKVSHFHHLHRLHSRIVHLSLQSFFSWNRL